MVNDNRDKPQKDAEKDEASGLRRWSQRKTQIRTEQRRAKPDLPPQNESQALPLAERIEAEKNEKKQALTDEDMPPIETLDEKSDLSPFFSPEVSAELRRLALRKIFHLPVYNIRDGLNDYDEDYTVFEPLGDVITADMRHMQEVAEKRRLQLAEAQAQQQAAMENEAGGVLPGQDEAADENAADENAADKEHDNEAHDNDSESQPSDSDSEEKPA